MIFPSRVNGVGLTPPTGRVQYFCILFEEAVMAHIVKKSPWPVYAVGLVWLVFGLFLPLYKLIHFLAAAGLSIAAYLVVQKLCPTKPSPSRTPSRSASPPRPQPRAGRTDPAAGPGPVRDASAQRQHRGPQDLGPDRPHGGRHRQNHRPRGGAPPEAAPDPQVSELLPAHHAEAPQRL